MPKCIVDYCRNYAGMRKNYANVILHGFPSTLERIKLWLGAIEQSGQTFEDLDEMAEKILEGKKFDSYRVCSEHFTIQCYLANGDKKMLKKDSVPTVFANRQFLVQPVEAQTKRRKQEPLQSQVTKPSKKKATRPLRGNKAAQNLKDSQKLAQKILNLTMEIIYLLTGEDYTVVRKSCPQIKLDRRNQYSKMAPQSRTLDWANEQKIQELSHQIIELLAAKEQKATEGYQEPLTMENPKASPLSAGSTSETGTDQVWLSPSTGSNVDAVQAHEGFTISSWTVTSEGNGTKQLVLCEEDVSRAAAAHATPETSQHSFTRVIEALPLPERGAQTEVPPYLSSIWQPRLPDTNCAQYLHIKEELSPCIESLPPPNIKVVHLSERLNILDAGIASDDIHPDPLQCKEGNFPKVSTLQPQYTPVIIKEEPVSPSEANIPFPDAATPVVHPQYTTVIIKPSCWEDHLGDVAATQAGHADLQNMKGPDPYGAENFAHSTIFTSLDCQSNSLQESAIFMWTAVTSHI